MKDQKKTEIKVGITVLISLILLLYIFGWAKNYDPFSESKQLTIQFNSVAGLDKGDRVMVNGIRKGFVENVFSEGTSVFVKLTLEPETDLREDAKFSIMMLDLMGGKKIEIEPGTSDLPLEYGKVQKGEFLGDISTAMSALGSVQKDVVEVIREVKLSLNSINKILGDEKLKSDLSSSFKNLNTLTVKLSNIIDENREGIKNLIIAGNNAANSANEILNENKENISSTLKKFEELTQNANNLIIKIDEFTKETKDKNNNIGKMIYDPDLLPQIKLTLEQTNELIKILLEQLKGDGVNVDANIF